MPAITVFISYARTDSAFVDTLEVDLHLRDFATWVDRQKLEGGDAWADKIQREIERCQVMVVVLSPDAVALVWVRREMSYAQGRRKRIIPLLYRPVEQVPIQINDLQWIDCSVNYQRGLADLLVVLKSVTPPAPT